MSNDQRVESRCPACHQALPQKERVLRAILLGAQHRREISHLAGVPLAHVAPLVGKLRDEGELTGFAGEYRLTSSARRRLGAR